MAIDTLIVSPHIDDEVLGCFSALGEKSFVLYCGCDESRINFEWVKQRPTPSERIKELNSLQKMLGFQYKILENPVNHYNAAVLIPSVEQYINLLKPTYVFIPVPSYNQDHRAAYEASLTAMRPHDMNHYVSRILVYEQIQDLWNHNYHQFKPTYFRPIDINAKVAAYKKLASQVRKFRSPKMLTDMAAIRGIQANCKHAEAFEVLRWVES